MDLFDTAMWLAHISFYVAILVASKLAMLILLNALHQMVSKDPTAPPIVFHWIPFIGSAISYGKDPYKFFFHCQKQYGDIFTFILLGKKITVYLGIEGNDFILNGKLSDLNAEEIYTPLTTPVFGSGVCYDCPNSKLMEQKKFLKFGFTSEALSSYVPMIEEEVRNYIDNAWPFRGSSGVVDIPSAMAEITIYTASRTLQGKEVRAKLDSSFARLYHDLDMGFSPINFLLPWAPLPHNRKRDIAQRTMARMYMDIIEARRQSRDKESADMIGNLMDRVYKDGSPFTDKEVAHTMITLLMGGQHSSSTIGSWIILRLTSQPEIMEELYQEQVQALGEDLPPLRYEDLQKLPLNQQVVKETLRLHAPIHSLMRKVKNPLPVKGTNWVIPASHVVLAAPGVTSKSEQYFKNADQWDPHRWDNRIKSDEGDGDTIDYGYGMVPRGTRSPYLPFGAGRHRCIGEQFAYMNLGTIIAVMVREFKFRDLYGRRGVVPDTDYSSLFSRPVSPAMIGWERRQTRRTDRSCQQPTL